MLKYWFEISFRPGHTSHDCLAATSDAILATLKLHGLGLNSHTFASHPGTVMRIHWKLINAIRASLSVCSITVSGPLSFRDE